MVEDPRTPGSKIIRPAALALVLLAAAPAQDEHTSQVSVPDDPVAQQALARADEALKQGDTDRGLKIWQEILDRLPGKVIQVHRGPRTDGRNDLIVEGDRFTGIRLEVMNKILALPEQGAARYAALMEPKAQELLARGAAAGDQELLRLAVLRYFLTPSGRRAGLLLVDLCLEEGRFDEARIHARRLREALASIPGEEKAAALALAREAWALRSSGRGQEIPALAASAPSAVADAEVAVAGQTHPLRDHLAVFAGAEGPPAPHAPAAPALRQPLTVFGKRMWYRPFAKNNNTSSGETYVFTGNLTGPRLFYFPLVPVVRDGVLYASDGRSVTARSLLTGDEIWPAVQAPVDEFSGRRNRNLYHHVVLDGNLVFAYLEGPQVLQGQRAFQNFEPIEDIPSRKLVAVDAATGRQAWSHHAFAGRSLEEREFISRFIVNQPPLVVGDTLFVAGTELLGVFQHWICAFERATGNLRWKTYTNAGQMELNMFGNPIKEATPGWVSEHDGVLYCCMNVGVVVALDASTGAVLWESAYEQEGIPVTENPVTYERHPGWAPSRAAVWKDRVFVAPTDSLDVYAVERATGAIRPIPGLRRSLANGNTWFLGVHRGVLLIGGNHVTAIDPETLEVRWRTADLRGDIRNGITVQGLPAILDDAVVFTSIHPERRVRISSVDLQGGAVKEFHELRISDRAGNVVVSADAIIVAGEDAIHAYFDLKDVENRLARAVQARPDDPDLLLRLGDVLQRQPDWAKALAHYEKARTRALAMGGAGRQSARRAALALFNGWLAVAREPALILPNGPARPEDRFHKALSYAEEPDQKVRALVECLEWAHVQNDDAAFARSASAIAEGHADTVAEVTGRLFELFPTVPPGTRLPAGLLASLASGARAEAGRRWREAVTHFHDAQIRYPDALVGAKPAWVLAGERIAGILKTAGPDAYRDQETAARRLLSEASAAGDAEGLRTLLRHYPQSSVIEEAWLALSRQLVTRGAYREALAEMQRYFARFARVSASALVEYARCLDRLEAHDSALQVLRALESRHAAAEVTTEEGTVRISTWVKKELQRAPFDALDAPPPVPAIGKGLAVAWTLGGDQGSEDARILDPIGRLPANGLAYVHLGGEILGVEVASGKAQWRKACALPPKSCLVHDGRLILPMDHDVVALDATSGAELWRYRLDQEDLCSFTAATGKAWLLLRLRGQNAPASLRALDLLSGATVHETPLAGVYNGTLSASPGYILVRGRDRERAAVCCDALTGAIVGTPLSFRSDAHPPFLTGDDLVVMVTGGANRSAEPVRVVGREPATQRDRWVFDAGRGNFAPVAELPGLLVFEMAAPMGNVRTPSGTTVAGRRVIALDLARGTARLNVALEKNEFTNRGGTIAGDRLFANLKVSTKTGSLAAEKIRAFDLDQGSSPWATTDFTGVNLMLIPYPTADWLLVRKSASSRSSAASEGSQLYFINQKTGAVDDLIELGATRYPAAEAGLVVRDGTLVLAAGPQVKGLRR